MKKKARPAGVLKKDALIVAGRLFRQHGYDKTTFRMIADELDVTPSAIAYHFKSKSWIVHSLFLDSMNILREHVRSNLTDGFNYYLYNGIVEVYFYRDVMMNEHVWTMFNRKDHVEMWTGDWISIFEAAIREVTDNFNKDFTEEEIHAAAVMNIGARIAIINELAKNDNMTVDKCCYYFMYLLGVLSRLDEATIQRNVEKAFEFIDKHEYPQNPFV